MTMTSAPDILTFLRERIGATLTEEQLEHKAALAAEINRLKRERGAIILGHNYLEPALFLTVPDITGDSLGLCRQAAETERNPILFCGVRFMAETAKILNPDRTVLQPSLAAGCSLAESISAQDVRELRAQYPGAPVITYVNTYADVKAECDICCTSGNAAEVVESFGAETVIFLPDEYLARNVARQTGREFILANRGTPGSRVGASTARVIIGWPGRCEVHEQFTAAEIAQARTGRPDLIVLAHPECSPEVTAAADYTGSTKMMIERVRAVETGRIQLMTESAMAENIAALYPDKELLHLNPRRCPHMERITLEQTLAALQENRYIIEVPDDIAARARRAVDRMLEIG